MRSLSSLVDFLTLVPTSSMPPSCNAATTDQDFTPPVMSNTFFPARRFLYTSMPAQAFASSRAMSASVRSISSSGAPFSISSREISRNASLVSWMP
jgi:hypothetical protein